MHSNVYEERVQALQQRILLLENQLSEANQYIAGMMVVYTENEALKEQNQKIKRKLDQYMQYAKKLQAARFEAVMSAEALKIRMSEQKIKTLCAFNQELEGVSHHLNPSNSQDISNMKQFRPENIREEERGAVLDLILQVLQRKDQPYIKEDCRDVLGINLEDGTKPQKIISKDEDEWISLSLLPQQPEKQASSPSLLSFFEKQALNYKDSNPGMSTHRFKSIQRRQLRTTSKKIVWVRSKRTGTLTRNT